MILPSHLGHHAGRTTLLAELLNVHYTGQQRYYHNTNHILKCIELFNTYEIRYNEMRPENKYSIKYAKELFAAIVFHDIVYEIRPDLEQGYNEVRSADFAATYGPDFFYNVDFGIVREIIMATCHTGEPLPLVEARWMVNFDLYTMATEDYKNIAQQIKWEYTSSRDISLNEYHKGRLKFLNHMIDRPANIFYSVDNPTIDTIFENLEIKAIANMKEEIDDITRLYPGGVV